MQRLFPEPLEVITPELLRTFKPKNRQIVFDLLTYAEEARGHHLYVNIWFDKNRNMLHYGFIDPLHPAFMERPELDDCRRVPLEYTSPVGPEVLTWDRLLNYEKEVLKED